MKLIMLKYKTPKGMIIEGKFLKTAFGYKPIFIDDGYLDKSNQILNEEDLKEIL